MSGQRRVYEAKVGPIRAQIFAAGGALAFFDASTRNEIIRAALLEGGKFWMRAFLPMRFSQYAYRLGYTVSQKWSQRKLRDLGASVPFLGFTPPGGGRQAPTWKGTNPEKMITAALNGASVRATAAAERASLTIRVPYGHPVREDTTASFRTLPTWEVDRIAEVVGKALADQIADRFKAGDAKPGRRAIPVPQVRALGAGTPRQLVVGNKRRVA